MMLGPEGVNKHLLGLKTTRSVAVDVKGNLYIADSGLDSGPRVTFWT
jgi:hypothetical protein